MTEFICEATDEEQCKQMVEFAAKKMGRIDILVLCAGISAHVPFVEYKSLDIVRKIMDVNFIGYVNTTKYAIPYLT